MEFITAVRGPDVPRDPIETTKAVHFTDGLPFLVQINERGHIDAYKDTGQPSGDADTFE